MSQQQLAGRLLPTLRTEEASFGLDNGVDGMQSYRGMPSLTVLL